jgi:hypothetical protein
MVRVLCEPFTRDRTLATRVAMRRCTSPFASATSRARPISERIGYTWRMPGKLLAGGSSSR